VGDNPDPRYAAWTRQADGEALDQDESLAAPAAPRTTVTLIQSRSIISRNQSPDVPFGQSVNPYQGCEHGCVYCFARPSHAYLDLSPGLDFETRLYAKDNAATLLRAELARPGYRPGVIALGANTDPYQPIERRYRLTRAVLEVLAEFGHPVGITTKSALVERDIDLLAPMAARGLVRVYLSISSLDAGLARILEPRATAPQRRMETVGRLAAAGIPVGVIVAPIIPAINDGAMETVLAAAAAAGASSAHYVLLRLPHEVRDLFVAWLECHFPQRAGHVMSLLQQQRGGRDNDPEFGTRMRGTGPVAELLTQRFRLASRRLGLDRARPELDCSQFQPPAAMAGQLSLF
jgi:DNA repair photolyase